MQKGRFQFGVGWQDWSGRFGVVPEMSNGRESACIVGDLGSIPGRKVPHALGAANPVRPQAPKPEHPGAHEAGDPTAVRSLGAATNPSPCNWREPAGRSENLGLRGKGIGVR